MKLIKSMALVLSLMLVMTGCAGKEVGYIASYNDTKIPAGIYLYYMNGNIYEAAAKVLDKGKDPFDQTIDGKKGSQWIVEKTQENLLAYIATEAESERLKITLDQETIDSIQSSLNDLWERDGTRYEKKGISKDSILKAVLTEQKKAKVLEAYYGEGGEKSATEEELKEYYQTSYARINQIIISKMVTKDDGQIPASGDTLAKIKENANRYFKMLESGEDFSSVLYTSKKDAAAAEGKEEPKPQEDEDAFANDIIVTKGQPYYPEAYISQIFATEVGKVGIYEDDNMYIVFVRKDVNANPEDFEKRKPQLGAFMKSEVINSELAQLALDMGATLNDSAVKKYEPKSFSKR